MHKLKMFALV